jgi:serine/threonine protein kinase
MPVQLFEPGYRLGKYEVLAHVGTGGMAIVYKARDTELGRLVALKILDPEQANREDLRERFRREAQHAARLTYKHIVTLHEIKEEQGFLYLVFEFVEGFDLEELIQRRGRLAPEEARKILIQAAKALDHAHRQGIIHRDIKPSNFLLALRDDKYTVKLTDMGLALTPGEATFRVTKAGYTVGTIDYMAPEQARDSSSADIRSDIYALGCTGYHMLAGRPPFAEGGLGERLYKHLEEPPPDLLAVRPDVSPAFWAILRRMLAKKREDRYQTPAELLVELKQTPAVAPRGRRTATPTPTPDQTLHEKPSSQELVNAPTVASPAPASPPEMVAAPPAAELPEAVDLPEEAAAPPRSTTTLEQAKAAAGQFERAREVLANGDRDYARQLLDSCCQLDPGNTKYRAALRKLLQRTQQGTSGRWFSSWSEFALSVSLKKAQRSGDHRKVLEKGEEVLARNPADVSTHLEMAESAEALGLLDLAVWLLEQGHRQVPTDTGLMRTLATAYEKVNHLSRAVAIWELVRKAEPTDYDVKTKIDSLLIRDYRAKVQYRRQYSDGEPEAPAPGG